MLEQQTLTQQRWDRERRDLEQMHSKSVKQLETRLYELEASNKVHRLLLTFSMTSLFWDQPFLISYLKVTSWSTNSPWRFGFIDARFLPFIHEAYVES